uniref:Uncharacterized protein LOC108049772 n=1 Tax=Drosophila rhopaloa TaxID=1041015 RepID=A0A6P4F8J2_DRORH
MDKTLRKEFRHQAKEFRRKFLEDENLVEVDAGVAAHQCCGDAFQDFNAQSHDAWLLQCPRGMDPRQLVNKRIKLPGRKTVGDLQVRATNYTAPQNKAIGYVNSKGKYALQKVPLTGYVVVSKRLNTKQPPEGDEEQVLPAAAVAPRVLFRVRHPLFGRDYKERIQVPEGITKAINEADKRNEETTARLRRTANYYKIRSQMFNTTQTLEQKENDVRQSVLTGVLPNFMKTTDGPNGYKNFVDGDVEEEAAPAQKSRKQKINGSVQADGHKLVRTEEEIPGESVISPKKNKKRKSNGQILLNEEVNALDIKVEIEEAVLPKKQKKHKSNGQIPANGAATASTQDEVIVIKDEPISPEKQKKRKNKGEVKVVIDDDVVVKNEEDLEAPLRKRQKHLNRQRVISVSS